MLVMVQLEEMKNELLVEQLVLMKVMKGWKLQASLEQMQRQQVELQEERNCMRH